jgi:hypothetical protein
VISPCARPENAAPPRRTATTVRFVGEFVRSPNERTGFDGGAVVEPLARASPSRGFCCCLVIPPRPRGPSGPYCSAGSGHGPKGGEGRVSVEALTQWSTVNNATNLLAICFPSSLTAVVSPVPGFKTWVKCDFWPGKKSLSYSLWLLGPSD